MFTLKDTELWLEDRLVAGGFGVEVRLEREAAVRLVHRSTRQSGGSDRFGVYRRYTMQFEDGADPAGIEVRLSWKCYPDFVLGIVEGEAKRASAFQSWQSFAAESGIAVTVERLGEVRGLMANYLHKDWWTRPHFDPDPSRLPACTQSLLWRDDAAYYRLLPVCGPAFRTDLCGRAMQEDGQGLGQGQGQDQGISIGLSSFQGGMAKAEALAFVLGSGADPYRLGDRLTDIALQALGAQAPTRAGRPYPGMLEYLGWCSWDAFYQQVDERGLLAKAEEFGELGLPVNWFMIDDGWLDEAEGKLQGFEAAKTKFPRGLADTIACLKARHGIRWVGVWHAIAGYWEGVRADSPIGAACSPYLHQTAGGSCIPYPEPARGFGFWHAWHGFLRKQGVDFVKVDGQSSIRHLQKHERSVGAAASAAHQALEASVALHFGGAMINCMGMASENVWHRPRSAVSRNSDDFMPKERHGFREHALQNAYNSYYHGSFYWGDWDMFWTRNHDDTQNAVLRAVSGGPVYVSDGLGATDPAKLRPLIYDDGRLLRCDRPAVPTADCLTADPRRTAIPLKIWNTAGGAGVVAAFHIHDGDEPVRGSVGADDVPDLAGSRVLVYEYFSQECRLLGPGERLAFTLAGEACKLYLLVPVSAGSGLVPVGATGKYVPAHAIARRWRDEQAVRVQLRPNCSGPFACWSDGAPIRATVDGKEVTVASRGDGLHEIELEGSDRSRWLVLYP